MQRYEKYKDSGVQWLGRVPEHWKCLSLKKILDGPLKYGASESGEVEYNDGDYRYIRITDISLDGKLKSEGKKWLSYEIAKDYIVEKGELLFARSGATVGKAYIFDEDIKACYAGYLIKAKLIPTQNPYFLAYYTKSIQYDNWKNTIFIQATIQNIGADKYSYLPIPLPPLSEQRAIVSFLDTKTSEIDTFIADKEKQISLLQEAKQTIIADAVTKGIPSLRQTQGKLSSGQVNPNVTFKDSGISWIGEIPEHWGRTKVSRIFRSIGSGTTPQSGNSAYYTDADGIPWLQSGDFKDNVVYDTSKKITKAAVEQYNLKLYEKDSIVIAMYGASIGKVGKLGIPTSVNQACCVIGESDKMLSDFAFYTFIAEKENLIQKSKGGTQPNISQEIIKAHIICLPPLSEQRAIVAYLEEKTTAIDTLIADLQREIEGMKEYKQRLISDVVTGQIKVC